MRFSVLFIVLLACGPMNAADTTAPLTEETCSSKVMRASNDTTECMLDRDTYAAELRETQELLTACKEIVDSQQKKIYSCNSLVNTYESSLVNTGCAIAEVSDGGEQTEGEVLEGSGSP